MSTQNNVPTTPHEVARAIRRTIPEEIWSRLGGGRQRRLLRQWEGVVDEHAEPRVPDVEIPAKIESTPAASWAQADWIRDLSPYVCALRHRLFDRPTAPFSPDTWGKAVDWIEHHHAQESKSQHQRLESALESKEYRRRLARARADAEWLSGRTGVPFQIHITPPLPLAYVDEEGDRVQVLHSYPEGPLFPLAQAVGTISDLAGFDPHAVTSWILAGVDPCLPRVRVRASVVEQPLLGTDSDADGWRRAPRVTVDFLVDDLRHQDLRQLHNAVRAAWKEIAAENPRIVKEEARKRARHRGRAMDEKRGLPPSPRSRRRLTAADMALRAIIEKVGEPSRTSKLTWQDVRERWAKEGHKPTTAEALRKRWERAKKKVGDLDLPGPRLGEGAQGGSVALEFDRDPDGTAPSGDTHLKEEGHDHA